MYKIFENPVPPKSSRFFVGGEGKSSISPAQVGDKIAIKASGDIEFQILIKNRDAEKIQGVIQHIEPDPGNGYNGWSVGDKIEIGETKTHAVDGLIACVWRN